MTNKKKGSFILALFIVVTLAVSPSFARMGGGSGGGSSSDGGGSMGGGGGSKGGDDSMSNDDSMDRDNRSGGTMMDADDMRIDVDSMPGKITGSMGSGDMTMDIKPVKYENGRLEVRFSANTHSVRLADYDLMELCTLEADGKVFRPVQADPLGGHHVRGTIAFEVPEQPDHFRIVIRDIPQIMVRTYEWN